MTSMINRKSAYWIIAAAITAYVFVNRSVFLSVGTVLLYAFAETLLLAPLSGKIEDNGVSSDVSALICVIGLFAMMMLTVSIAVPYLITHVPPLIQRSLPVASAIIKRVQSILRGWGLEEWFSRSVSEYISRIVPPITAYFAKFGIQFVSQTSRFIFSLAITFHLLRERKKLLQHLLLFIPIKRRIAFLKMMKAIWHAVMGYMSGLIKTSLFITLGTYFALSLLKIPDALLLSMIMGIFELLPYIGPVIGSVPILISAIPMGMKSLVFSALLIILVQQIEGNIVSPYFTASSTSIHPLTALLAVFFFGSLLGIWGIILAIPVVVTAKSALCSFRQLSEI